MSLTVLYPTLPNTVDQDRLDRVLDRALAGREVRLVRRAEDLSQLQGERILFALSLDEAGQNFEYYRMLSQLRREPELLEGCTGGLVVDGPGELYTKSTAAELALAMNRAGCALLGRPLVEATGSLANFRIQAKNLGTDLAGAYEAAVADTAQRLEHEVFARHVRPKLLVLHASSHHTSNTMALWSALHQRLGENWDVTEIGLRNGTLSDCAGCPYTMCLHFGERGGCFYGGVMQSTPPCALPTPCSFCAPTIMTLSPPTSPPASTASPLSSGRPAFTTRRSLPWWCRATPAVTPWPGRSSPR